MGNLNSIGQIIGLTQNSTNASATATSGRTATKPSNMILLGNESGDRNRSLEIIPFGVGSENGTFTLKVFGVWPGIGPTNEILDYDVRELVSCTVTLGTATGTWPSIFTSSNLIADTISTITVSTLATDLVAKYLGVAPFAHSPADNSQAILIIPEMGNAYGFFVETSSMTNVTSTNFLWRYDT